MSYQGNKPATSFESPKKDRFTGISGTTCSLTYAVSSVSDIIVWVNSVKQDFTNYSVSGNTLTLGGTLVSADIVEVTYVGRTYQSVNPNDASVGANQVQASIITGQTALATTPADTDELLISDAGTLKRVDYSYLKSTVVNRPNAQNLVINSNMAIAQRNSGTVAQSDGSNEGYATVDRMNLVFGNSAGGVITTSRDTTAPTGFGQSMKFDVTTADGSVASNQMVYMKTSLEAQDIRNSGWNYTSSSSYLTLSFWVRSSKTGIYCAFLETLDASYMRSSEYTISSADTWEQKVLTFPGKTELVFNNDNGAGLNIGFTFVVGTDRDGTNNTWETTNYGTSNQVNFLDSTSNVLYLTGIQLEVGEYTSSTLPPFQHESFADNLRRCHRYCYVMGSADNAENGGQFTIGSGLVRSSGSAKFTDIVGSYPQPLRTLPSVTQVGGDMADLFCYKDDGTSADPTSISIGRNTIALRLTNNMGTSSGLTAGDATVQQIVEADTNLVFSAEL